MTTVELSCRGSSLYPLVLEDADARLIVKGDMLVLGEATSYLVIERRIHADRLNTCFQRIVLVLEKIQ